MRIISLEASQLLSTDVVRTNEQWNYERSLCWCHHYYHNNARTLLRFVIRCYISLKVHLIKDEVCVQC